MKSLKLMVFFVFLSIFFFSCSDNDPVSPESEIQWQGLTSQNLPISITVKNTDGIQKVIAYSLQYSYTISGGTISGTSSQSNSEGIVNLTDNSFIIILDETSSDFLSGTLNDNSFTGSFTKSVVLSSSDTPVKRAISAFNMGMGMPKPTDREQPYP